MFAQTSNEITSVRQGERDLPVVGRADVVVVGGGISGVVAAISAAEEGRSVIIIESRNYFGQELTATYKCNGSAWRPANSGKLTTQIYNELSSEGILTGKLFDPIKLGGYLLNKINAHPEIGVYLFSRASEVIYRDGRAQGVILSGRAGRQVVLAKAVVDATDDARISASAGAKFIRPATGNKTARRFISVKRPEYLPIGPRPVLSNLGIDGDSIMIHDSFIELAVRGKVGTDIAGDLSVIHSETLEKSFALRTQLALEGIELDDFIPSPETWFDEMPVVSCRDAWSEKELASFNFSRSAPVIPRGVNGLVVAGRTVDGSPQMSNLQALVRIGELAGRTAAGLSRDVSHFLPTDVKAPLARENSKEIHVRELLDGIEENQHYPRIRQPGQTLPVHQEFDVVVVGGGTSGAIAAISAARHGANVAVIEILPNLGGISSNRVNTYYWGVPWKSLLRQELGDKIQLEKSSATGPLEKVPFSGEDKKIALQELALGAGVRIYYQSLAVGAVVDGAKVRGVVVENASGRHVVLAKIVIDATGHGGIAVAAGAKYVKGRETDGFLNEIEHGPLRDPTNLTDISTSYLKYPSYAISMNIRESRRIVGEYTVTFEDVIHARPFPDIISRWRSNYDTHLPSSANQTDISQDWVAILGLWRKPIMGSIPYRSILPKGLENILVAAMSYSTDHDALIGGRMQPDMEHLGEAAGVAAAMSVRLERPLREIPMRELQKELVRLGVLRTEDVGGIEIRDAPSLEVLHRQDLWRAERERDFPSAQSKKKMTLKQAVDKLGSGEVPDKTVEGASVFGEMESDVSVTTDEALDAMVQLYLAGDEVIPLLKPLLEAHGKRPEGFNSVNRHAYQEAAVLLGLLGDRSAVPALLGFLKERNTHRFEYKLPQASSRPSLPLYWISAILLGRFGEKAAVPELLSILDNASPKTFADFPRKAYGDDMFRDTNTCPPSLASFIIVALGRIGDPSAAEAIRPFLNVSVPTGIKRENIDFETAWGIRTNAAWALARMGDNTGVPVLIELLEADQALLRAYAQRLLERITGKKLGGDGTVWKKWWQSNNN